MFETKRLSQIGLLTGLGAVLPAVGTAEASPVCTIFPCAFTVSSSPAEVNDPGETSNNDLEGTTVTFNKFDPSLGTLTEIDVSLDSTVFGNITVNASGQSEGTTSGKTSWTATLNLTMPGGLGFQPFVGQSDSVSCSEIGSPAFCSNSAQPNFEVTFTRSTTTQSILDQYTGTGTLDATFGLDLALTELNQSTTLGSSASGGGSMTWDPPPPPDGLTITYIFTPNSTVPEPGTLALLGMGAMAGLGFARRRLKPDG